MSAPALPRWYRNRRYELRTSLWLVPSLIIGAFVVLALGALAVDDHLLDHGRFPVLLDPGSATDVRNLMVAIAGASITVVALVASLTLVTLTVASTQFGPRLIRSFLATRAPKVTIGLYVGTFVYSLIVLLAVHDTDGVTFVPRLAADLAVLAAIVDAIALVAYLHATAVSIQPATVVNRIANQLDEALDELAAMGVLVGETDPAEIEALMARIVEEGEVVVAAGSGYVKRVEHADLVAAAAEAGAAVHLVVRPGQFVLAGSPLARVLPGPDGRRPDAATINAELTVGAQRTVEQDLRFAVDQLVEIALRALSPAVNDTFTALTCINWLAGALLRLSEDPLPQRAHRDAGGTIRVVDRYLSFADVTDSAFDKIRQAGSDNPAVLIRLLESVTLLAPQMRTREQHDALGAQADMVWEAAEREIPIAGDLADVRRRYDEARAALALPPVRGRRRHRRARAESTGSSTT
ncbi:MAG: DUF2254 domain-containing protein [Acidimicrobiales bacterium]|nr:DUF2254 domain-containing protein [Acidimicrobiales bacterium]